MTEYFSAWFANSQKDKVVENTKKYKMQRLELACVLRDLIRHFPVEVPFFIEGGTALGAYRDGKTIPHDDDFDYGLYGDEESLQDLYINVREEISDQYQVRLVQSYCRKLEIYEPKYGKFMLNEEFDFHNVTVDFLLYKDHPEDNEYLQIQYFKRPYHKLMIPKAVVFPLADVVFEEECFPCPNDQKAFLEIYYGYLGEDSYYDPETNSYKKQKS